MNDNGQPVLYTIVTGSPAASDIGKLVDLAQADGGTTEARPQAD